MNIRSLLIMSLSGFWLLTSCDGQKDVSTTEPTNTAVVETDVFDLSEIQDNGEIIVLTLYGPNTFFEFKGRNFGSQYMIMEEYAKSIGVCTRVEVMRSQSQLIEKLENGEGDVIVYNMDVADSLETELTYCGEKEISAMMDSLRRNGVMKNDTISGGGRKYAWAVRKSSEELAVSLSDWLRDNSSRFPEITALKYTDGTGRTYAPKRHVYSPIRNIAKGEISVYDDLFKRYSKACGWDWRLMAAQAYQESAFDSQAVSWAGAMGLMQLMPSTARSVGVSQSEVFVPEKNVKGATELIVSLNKHYSTIADGLERIQFVLAAYNAGAGHVDDARRLAEKYGKNPNVWKGNVDGYVLKMCESDYYDDSVVKHGYFRGTETFDYVYNILSRWEDYRRKIKL